MSVTLSTLLESLMFSSQIPDIDLSTSDDHEAVMSIVSGGSTVFSATHIPYSRNITVHDIRSVVEYYMRQGNHALRSFTLRARHNEATQTLATFQVIYLEQHFTGDIEEFLRNNFLTTMEGKLMWSGATEFLYYYKKAYSQESVLFIAEGIVSRTNSFGSYSSILWHKCLFSFSSWDDRSSNASLSHFSS